MVLIYGFLKSLPSPDFVVPFCDTATVNVRPTDTIIRKKGMISSVLSSVV